jgi:RAB protein geranylgeranyltransferase component A
MDTLDNTEWDVLIVGTGLQQSLLALYVCRIT